MQFFGPLQERQCYQTSFFHEAYMCIYTFLLPILPARRAALVPESSTNYWQVFRQTNYPMNTRRCFLEFILACICTNNCRAAFHCRHNSNVPHSHNPCGVDQTARQLPSLDRCLYHTTENTVKTKQQIVNERAS